MTDNIVVSLNTPQDPLTELIRQGARDLIAQAVEAELQQLRGLSTNGTENNVKRVNYLFYKGITFI